MLGWSLYDLSLRVWLAEVAGAGQLLVTYTEELDAAPERVLSAIERHVGLDAHKYKNAHQKNNVAGCYGWQNKGAVHHSKGAAGCKGAGSAHKEELSKLRDARVAELAAFYRPHVAEMHRMADEGLIARPPATWLEGA